PRLRRLSASRGHPRGGQPAAHSAANQLKGVRGDLEDLRDQWAMDGKIQGLQGIGNVIFTLEGLEAKVRHAEGGYSGLSATIQIKETELDRLYEYDYAMLESLDKAP